MKTSLRESLNLAVKTALIIALIELVSGIVVPSVIPTNSVAENTFIHVTVVVCAATSLLLIFVILPLISQRRQLLNESQEKALRDPLTGLPNRLILTEHMGRCLSGNPRYAFFGALLYFDLDGFKIINDTYGHDAGDAVLTAIGQRLRDTFRNEDIVSRVGGDEFALLIQKLNGDLTGAKKEAYLIAEKIRAVVALPIELLGRQFEIECSIGVCMFTEKRISPALALREADLAMYKAKRRMSHKIVFTDELEFKSYGIAITCVPEIDMEHQELDALLEEAIASKEGHDAYLSRIIHAIHQHFENEEQVSRKKALNMTAEHIAKHRQIVDRMSRLREPGVETPRVEIFKGLQDILRDHVVTFDRQLTLNEEYCYCEEESR